MSLGWSSLGFGPRLFSYYTLFDLLVRLEDCEDKAVLLTFREAAQASLPQLCQS